MIPNLYVDHLADSFLSTQDELRQQMVIHHRTYDEAALRIGMNSQEVREVKEDLLMDRHVTYGPLPRHIKAMAGKRGSYIYAVHDAYIKGPAVMGWRIVLNNGKVIYIPQICGNLAVGYNTVVTHHVHKTVYVPPVIPSPIYVAPPTDLPPVVEPIATAIPVVVTPANHSFPYALLAPLVAIPFLFNGGHNSPQPPSVPPCSSGSNAQFACQK